jgi:tRNA dimethylallyltransferase
MVAKVTLLGLVGPTASGKTALAIDIAKKYDGEIIAADSRTVYRGLDIGTAKPSPQEQSDIPHYGIDLVGPGDNFTVADFKLYANKKIKDIQNRGNLPILVGGSGLYIDAVLYDFSLVSGSKELRGELEGLSLEQLQDKIKQFGLTMPENLKNRRYLIRTLERGQVESSKKPLPKGAIIIGVNPPKGVLRQRIEERALLMVKSGVIEEVKNGGKLYGWGSAAMTGGIYRAFKGVVEGEKTIDQGIAEFILSDLRLAKKQLTWLRRNKDINWFKDSRGALDWFNKEVQGKLIACD